MSCATHSYRTRLHDFLDSRDFYELCQNYRHVNQRLYQSEGKTVEAFEALKAAILEQAIGADYKVNVPPPGPLGSTFEGKPIYFSEVWKTLDWCMDEAELEDIIGSPLKDANYEVGVRRGLTIAQNILNGWRPKKMPPLATTSPIEKEKPCS